MDASSKVICLNGIILFMCLGITASFQLNAKVLNSNRFEDNDARTRHKRNAADNTQDNNKTIIVKDKPPPKLVPQWKTDLHNKIWYGSDSYMNRKLYKNNPNLKPTICYNNVTGPSNTTALKHFICPMSNQTDDYVYCCGTVGEQFCCNEMVYEEEEGNMMNDLDLATGLGIAASFIGAVSFCMCLYCCCCQRRPEIHDGIKLIWVRRSFGKEIHRLEQQNAQPQQRLAISRTGSKLGSRSGSRQGSRNQSVGPSPSVSRRASVEPSLIAGSQASKGTGRTPSGKRKAALELPSSSVTITVTTPSDDHGPTEPLLKTSEQKGNTDNEHDETNESL